MANLYKQKRSDVFWCWGYDRKGRRWYRSTGQRDRRAALAAARAIEVDIAASADPAADKARERAERATLEKAIKLMLDAAERAERAPRTISYMIDKSRHLMRVIGASKLCGSITLATTTKYVDTRLQEGAHRHTIRHEVRTLIQALRRAQKLGLLVGGLEPRVLMPDELAKAYKPRERWLGHDELDRLVAQLSPQRGEYVLVLAWTGVRISELFGLRPEHFDAARNELLVMGTKTRKSRRRIPVAAPILPIIQRRVEETEAGNPLFPKWHKVQRDIDAACLRIEAELNPGWARPAGKQAHGDKNRDDGTLARRRNAKGALPPKKDRVAPPNPFPTVTPNDLRRSFASWLASSGVPIQQAMELMGHSSPAMLTQVYARLSPAALHSAIAIIENTRTTAAAPTVAPAPQAASAGKESAVERLKRAQRAVAPKRRAHAPQPAA